MSKGIEADLWLIAQRWQQYDGEQRANLLRMFAIGSFYSVHLLNYYQPFGLSELAEQPDRVFHQSVTVLAVAWAMLAVGVDLCLRQRVFPRFLPYLTTAADLCLLTAILALGGGQASPLVLAYLLIIILAALRLTLRLVQCATTGAILGYLFLMGMARWSEVFGIDSIGRVPRYAQVMTLLAIALSGIMLGQLVRGVRGIAETFSDRRHNNASNESVARDNSEAGS